MLVWIIISLILGAGFFRLLVLYRRERNLFRVEREILESLVNRYEPKIQQEVLATVQEQEQTEDQLLTELTDTLREHGFDIAFTIPGRVLEDQPDQVVDEDQEDQEPLQEEPEFPEVPEPDQEPEPGHRHRWRKDGTCRCGAVKNKRSQSKNKPEKTDKQEVIQE